MIICADDFGLAPDIDEVIVRLAEAGRISAMSIMVSLLLEPSPALAALLRLRDRLDLGLHLVLTDEPRLAPSEKVDSLHRNGRYLTFAQLLYRSLTGRVRAADARREIAEQYEWCVNLLEGPPDFLDGHLHVQQLFGVRHGLLDFLATLPAGQRPYVRNAYELREEISRRGVAPVKCWLISLLGDRLRKHLLAQAIPTNDGFAGICDYAQWRDYPSTLATLLRHARPGNYLIMTHPGQREDWRRAEFEGLLATALPADEPTRFRRV